MEEELAQGWAVSTRQLTDAQPRTGGGAGFGEDEDEDEGRERVPGVCSELESRCLGLACLLPGCPGRPGAAALQTPSIPPVG